MTAFLELIVSNALFAAVLALIAFVVDRTWQNRQVSHLLWVMVLAKLITPPLWHVPVHFPVAASGGDTPSPTPIAQERRPQSPDFVRAVPSPEAQTPDHSSASWPRASAGSLDRAVSGSEREGKHSRASSSVTLDSWVTVTPRSTLLAGWLVSTCVCLTLVLVRIRRFHRLVQAGTRPDEAFVWRLESLSKKLGLRRIPDVRWLDGSFSPMVWPLARRPVVLLPVYLRRLLTPDQLDTVLAHELAHIVRHDLLVRYLETCVTSLFWWNPLVWLARRELHAAEEECCDGLVVSALPESRRQYGEALLCVAETIMSRPPVHLFASTLVQHHRLKERVAMILSRKLRRNVPWPANLALLVLAVVVLPVVATAQQSDETTSAPTNASSQLSATPKRIIRPLLVLSGADTRIERHERQRIVDSQAWIAYWLSHTGQSGTPADYSETHPSGAPSIDFEQCMVLAITESPGQLNSGIRLVSLIETDQALIAHYENQPYQAREGKPAPGNAFGFFIVPRSSKEIVLYHNIQQARLRAGEPPVWEEIGRLPALEKTPSELSALRAQNGAAPANAVNVLNSTSGPAPAFRNGLQSTATGPQSPRQPSPPESINIGFAHDPGPGHYDGVVGLPHDVWNFVDIGTTAIDYMRSAAGLSTPVTLKVSQHDGEWGIQGCSGIFHGYIYHNCQCVDLSATFTGIPAGRYKAIVYAHGDAPNQNAEVELAVGPESYGRKATLNDGSWKFRQCTLEEGVQFVTFEFTAIADCPVTITSHRAGSAYSMLNAIQIVPLPGRD